MIISPLRSDLAGGSHVRRTLVELMPVAVKFCGAPPGTEGEVGKRKGEHGMVITYWLAERGT